MEDGEEAVVMPGEGGRIARVFVRSGEPVFQGQRLFAFESRAVGAEAADGYVLMSEGALSDDEEADEGPGWEYVLFAGRAGLVQRVAVAVGLLVQGGEELCLVRPSVRLAHLLAADLESARERKVRSPDDWRHATLNGRFQALVKRFSTLVVSGTRDAMHSDELASVCQQLERVTREFADRALRYGKLIIHELHSASAADRTVRPLGFMNGVLGGEKYICGDILFKFGSEKNCSGYPDAFDIAIKIQGHELKGCKAYFGTFFNDNGLREVSFPLISLIDFMGYRITAISVLPIDQDTLCYGSDDAGNECFVKTDDEDFYRLVTEASRAMNLCPHEVPDGRFSGKLVNIASAVDLEGHLGKDGQRYLLDFSRSLPPACKRNPPDYDRLWPFYHMLRAEFVQSYHTPLSPDAFSSFQRGNSAELNANVSVATGVLETRVVAEVATVLRQWKPSEKLSLSLVFHQRGLNMRYLGLVYEQVCSAGPPPTHVRHALVVDALSRCFKRRMRHVMRSHRLELCAEELNKLFITYQDRGKQWPLSNAFVSRSLQADFHFSDLHAQEAVELFFRHKSIKFGVLVALSNATGMGIAPGIMTDLASGDLGVVHGRTFDTAGFVFEESDLFFQERVKHLDIVERVLAVNLYQKGLKTRQDYSQAIQYQLRALNLVKTAVASNPHDCQLNLCKGDICHELWNVMRQGTEERALDVAKLFRDMADKAYQRALEVKPVIKMHAVCYRNYAKYLLRSSRLYECERILQEGLKLENLEPEIREEMEWIMGQMLIKSSGGDDDALAASIGGASTAAGMSNGIGGSRSRRGSINSNSLSKNSKMIKSIRRLSAVGASFAGSVSSLGGIFDASTASPVLSRLSEDETFQGREEEEAELGAKRNKLLLDFFSSSSTRDLS